MVVDINVVLYVMKSCRWVKGFLPFAILQKPQLDCYLIVHSYWGFEACEFLQLAE